MRDIIDAFKTGILYTIGVIFSVVIIVFIGFLCRLVLSTIFDLLV